MPGIFGLLDKSLSGGNNGGRSADLLADMAAAMMYDPAYESVLHGVQDLGIRVGWAGLAPAASHCRVDSHQGILALVAGEPAGGSRSAPSQVIDDYVRVGDSFPAQTASLCSGLLVDRRQGVCFLFCDRFGVERLFVYEDDVSLAFASEAKAILAAFPDTRAFDRDGLAELVSCGCTLGETTLFRKVRALAGGSILKLARAKPRQSLIIGERAEWEAALPARESEFVDQLAGSLKASVREFAGAGLPMGVSLTGGLDSRLVMACLDGEAAEAPCYTFGSMYRDTQDVIRAGDVARACGRRHQSLILGKEFLSYFGSWLARAALISDGYLGFSGAAELYLNSLVRDLATLRMTGNYGGELLRGIRAFKCLSPRSGWVRAELRPRLENVEDRFQSLTQAHPCSFALFIQAPAGYGRYAIERSQVVPVSPFLNRDVARLMYRNPHLGGKADATFDVIRSLRPDLLSIPTDRGLLGAGGRLRRGMRHLYQQATFKMEYWTGDGMPGWMARASGGRLGASLFAGRHKFQHFRSWLQHEIAADVRSVLDQGRASSLNEHFDVPAVLRMLDSHIRGGQNFVAEIDTVATLMLAESQLFTDLTGKGMRLPCLEMQN